MNSAPTRVPKRLRREPLFEAIWQVVYEAVSPDVEPAAALPGYLHQAAKKRLGKVPRIRPLPAAEIPQPLLDRDPQLRYAPKYRIEFDGEPVLYQVGDRLASVNCRRPYIGWQRFRQEVMFLREVLEESGLVSPQTHAIRYLNLIERRDAADLGGLRLKIEVGGCLVTDQPAELRVQVPRREQTHVLHISNPARVQVPGEQPRQGVLVILETHAADVHAWEQIAAESIDALHEACKDFFFREVLRPETVERLEPEYE